MLLIQRDSLISVRGIRFEYIDDTQSTDTLKDRFNSSYRVIGFNRRLINRYKVIYYTQLTILFSQVLGPSRLIRACPSNNTSLFQLREVLSLLLLFFSGIQLQSYSFRRYAIIGQYSIDNKVRRRYISNIYNKEVVLILNQSPSLILFLLYIGQVSNYIQKLGELLIYPLPLFQGK